MEGMPHGRCALSHLIICIYKEKNLWLVDFFQYNINKQNLFGKPCFV